MTLTIRVERYGRAAAAALQREIAAAQADDALAPVTVLVARSSIGLAMRRVLASGDLAPATGGRAGVVNVRFLTLPRLADQLGSPALMAADRQPAAHAVQRAAVRAALAANPAGPFGSVRNHPATERAVQSVIRELRSASPESLRRLAGESPRAAEVARLAADVRHRLAAWYDEHDLAEAARRAIESGPPAPIDELGTVVLFLPLAVPPADRRLVEALAARRPVVVILGATGEPATDEAARDLASALAPGADLAFPEGDIPDGTAVVSAPNADAEVLLALRGIMARHRDGTPLERMAVVHGGADPYPRLLHESFSLAAIPTNGAGVRPLSATLVGRTLLGALSLGDRGWRRDDVIAWVSGAPVRHDGRAAPATAWDAISRDAGITAGLDPWAAHLAAHATELRAKLEGYDRPDADGVSDSRRRRAEQNLELTNGLNDFVAHLAARLEPDPAPSTWIDWQRWADRFLRDYLGEWSRWPDGEDQAFTEIQNVLGGLSVLDRVDPNPDAATFRGALTAELDGPAPETSRFGQGVLVGRFDAIVGLDLDTVFVVGMSEGVFPTRVRDDALLPDAERQAAGPDVPLRSARALDARRAYLAALASSRERVLSFARGDQRRGREQRPSRWLLDTVDRLHGQGRRLFSRDLATLGPVDGFEVLPSYSAAVRTGGEAASLADRDLRSLARWFDRKGRLDAHPLVPHDPVLRLGLQARHERQSHGFTRFDGRVGRAAVPSADSRGALSPTSLEAYAACPRRYFLSKVLWVSAPERPEDIQRISAMDRGSLIHQVLERFIGEHLGLDRADRIRPHQRWSADDRARLDAITEAVFAEYEQHGLTGRALLWQLDQTDIRRDLHTFLDYDDRYRAERGVVPEQVELAFGPDDGVPVEIQLADGRTLGFRGMADRVDLAADGSAVVLDYKTGSDHAFKSLEGADPVARGTKLQLPIYGLAARRRLGDVPVPVHASYWFLSEKGRFRQIGYDLDPALGRFHEAIEVIVGGIEAGSFPARPGPEDTRLNSFENCRYCEFDQICPPDRDRGWDRVRPAPELAAYVALAEDAPA